MTKLHTIKNKKIKKNDDIIFYCYICNRNFLFTIVENMFGKDQIKDVYIGHTNDDEKYYSKEIVKENIDKCFADLSEVTFWDEDNFSDDYWKNSPIILANDHDVDILIEFINGSKVLISPLDWGTVISSISDNVIIKNLK